MEELMKVPDSVIIKSLQEEVKTLRKKNHEFCTKAKQREEHWKAYTEYLLNSIKTLESDDDEEKKLLREAKAIKKANEDYNKLLEQHNIIVEKYKLLKLQVKDLKSQLEGKPITDCGLTNMELRKRFNKLKNQRAIMDEMCFSYNERVPKAYNAVVFLEWVRTNKLWEKLLELMYEE